MVGASGAIFGLAGALVVYGYRYRTRIPRRYGAMFGGGLLPLIGINIAFGLLVHGIDNSAHLGGLAAGAVVAFFLRPLADEVTPVSWLSVRRVGALVVLGLVVGSLILAGGYFVRYRSIFDTDASWMVTEKLPGNLSVLVPASWVKTARAENSAGFQSVCYDGRLEARAYDVSKGLPPTFLAELARLEKAGFRLVGPAPYLTASLLNDLYMRGRVEARMQGSAGVKTAAGMQRLQVFLLPGKTLVSIGLEIPENQAGRFVPIQDRILSLLPE
jgi:hypothetical protein